VGGARRRSRKITPSRTGVHRYIDRADIGITIYGGVCVVRRAVVLCQRVCSSEQAQEFMTTPVRTTMAAAALFACFNVDVCRRYNVAVVNIRSDC